MEITFEHVPTNGIKLHVAFSGPKDGEPVILLHGFPDSWFGWESQIRSLATSGYRVIAPDQRGYNLSDKPKGAKNYQMDLLVSDLTGLADYLGFEQFNLAGHDFGAIVSWWAAMYYPNRIKRLVIANVPHPIIMNKYMRRNLSQIRKSWYAFFFQIPAIPERLIRSRNWKMLASAMAKGLSEEQLDHYRQAWSQPDAMTSMINWYRAIRYKSSEKRNFSPRITVPTLIIWGKQDPHIRYEWASRSLEMCEDGRLVTFEDASHWVHQDRPEEVSNLLIERFQS
ncbi:MAG: alpha/beta fold hydrolase [Candidatus Hodarchaeales archaeon]|jgi:pimeloyl-ACP methyl ester carboxylesterase